MEKFIISPDDCLILSAFKNASSLREAAKILNCDPAGLQRKTQRISEEHGLLQKIQSRWALTDAGLNLVGWLDESIAAQKKMLLGSSSLRISSTAWFAEQFLIPNFKALKDKLPAGTQFQFSTPSRSFETHLIEGVCDFVIVCHPPEDPAIAHKQLFKEEWVVIAPASWKTKQKLSMNDLSNKPFIRHEQLNPDIFHLDAALLSKKTNITIDNLIGVRSAVAQGHGWSIVPKILATEIIKNKEVVVIDHNLDMDRKVCVWWLRRRSDSKKLSPLICQFIQESAH